MKIFIINISKNYIPSDLSMFLLKVEFSHSKKKNIFQTENF